MNWWVVVVDHHPLSFWWWSLCLLGMEKCGRLSDCSVVPKGPTVEEKSCCWKQKKREEGLLVANRHGLAMMWMEFRPPLPLIPFGYRRS